MAKRAIVFDTETTGLSVAEGDRIISMACVEMLDGKPAREIEFFVNPGRPSNPHALAVHGLTEEFLADKPRFHEVADEFLAFVGDDPLIIHNSNFDMKFLRNELHLAGRNDTLTNPIIDTYKSFRFGFSPPKNSLDYILNQFQIDRSSREQYHGALTDARLLSQVYQPVVEAEKAALANPSKELAFAMLLNEKIEKAGLPYDYFYVAKTADSIAFMQSSNYMRGTEICRYDPSERELPLEAVKMMVKTTEAIIDAKQHLTDVVWSTNRRFAGHGIQFSACNPSWQHKTLEDGTKDIAGGELKVDLRTSMWDKDTYRYDMPASDAERHLGEMTRAYSHRINDRDRNPVDLYLKKFGLNHDSNKGSSFGL